MRAFWFTFKPNGPRALKGWPTEKLTDLVSRFEVSRDSATVWWRCASFRQARVGDRAYVFKQGDHPLGIFGVGEIIADPEERDEPSDEEGLAWRALLRFDALVDPTKDKFLLRLDQIEDIVQKKTVDAQASGTRVLPEEVIPKLEARLAPFLGSVRPLIEATQADDAAFDPDSATDLRQRALRAICIRRGQPDFRSALLRAYGKRCAVTGCPVEDVLEAAHIVPYGGKLTNDVSNGLLLRADIHTLFDAALLAIHPETRRVVIAERLKGSSYANLADKPLRRPADDRYHPGKTSLQRRFAEFEALEAKSPR